MSNRLLPEPPAHPELRPAPPQFTATAREEAAELRGLLGPGELLTMGAGGRHFLHRDPAGRETFLKLVDETSLTRQIEADRVARFLTTHGVSCGCLLDDDPVALANGRYLLAYLYIAHRFADTKAEDLRRLGLLLGRMHQALRELPQRRMSIERTVERLKLLRERAGEIRAGVPASSPRKMPTA